MSILINGVDMPKDDEILCINIKANGDVCYSLDLSVKTIANAVHVPPHGRLIDADALEDFVIALKRDAIHAYELTGKSGEWNARIFERERFAQAIEDAPTIIPAGKED